MENSAKSYVPPYFASHERVSARLRRVSSFCQTPVVNNRPAGLPGPRGRSALSHRPRGWRCPCASIRARGTLDAESSINGSGLQRGAYGWQPFSQRQAASRRYMPKARLTGVGGRERNAGYEAGAVHALVVWVAPPSTGGSGTISYRVKRKIAPPAWILLSRTRNRCACYRTRQ